MLLSFCKKIKVVRPENTLGKQVCSEADFHIYENQNYSKRHIKQKNINIKSKSKSKAFGLKNYIFKRGQLRNRSSDISCRIPILISKDQDQLRDYEDSEEAKSDTDHVFVDEMDQSTIQSSGNGGQGDSEQLLQNRSLARRNSLRQRSPIIEPIQRTFDSTRSSRNQQQPDIQIPYAGKIQRQDSNFAEFNNLFKEMLVKDIRKERSQREFKRRLMEENLGKKRQNLNTSPNPDEFRCRTLHRQNTVKMISDELEEKFNPVKRTRQKQALMIRANKSCIPLRLFRKPVEIEASTFDLQDTQMVDFDRSGSLYNLKHTPTKPRWQSERFQQYLDRQSNVSVDEIRKQQLKLLHLNQMKSALSSDEQVSCQKHIFHAVSFSKSPTKAQYRKSNKNSNKSFIKDRKKFV